jgi:uncharacterized cupredoxin-like copper-binding protein
MVAAIVLALAYVVAVWAMTGKPGKPNLGAAAPPPAGAPTINVTATEFNFKLSKASIPHGKVVFMLTNNGKLAHDFSISGSTSSLVSPGKTATLTATLAAGTLTYVCTVPGHAAAGMKGTFTVK